MKYGSNINREIRSSRIGIAWIIRTESRLSGRVVPWSVCVSRAASQLRNEATGRQSRSSRKADDGGREYFDAKATTDEAALATQLVLDSMRLWSDECHAVRCGVPRLRLPEGITM